jgi:hypothetical protein
LQSPHSLKEAVTLLLRRISMHQHNTTPHHSTMHQPHKVGIVSVNRVALLDFRLDLQL